MTDFDVRVECAFDSGFQTAASARGWRDVTAYVEGQNQISITRGRQDEFSQVQPSSLTGLVFNNTDGRFTPQNPSGAYYPNVKKGRPLRARVRYPSGQAGNFLTADQASVEGSLADWAFNTLVGTYDLGTSVAQSSTRAQDGTKSVLATWSTTTVGNWCGVVVNGLTIGRTYTGSVYVYVPAGSPDVRLVVGITAASGYTSTKGAWQRLSVTWTATATSHFVGVGCGTATSGQQCWIDAMMVDEGSSVQTFTTNPPPIYDLFTGYVDEWEVTWPDGGDTYATTSVSASSRSARMANSAPLRSVIEEEIQLDNVGLYFTLGDDSGATTAGNSAPTRQDPLIVDQTGTGGTLEFGAGTGPGTDGMSAPIFTRDSPGNGLFLKAFLTQPLTQFLDGSLTMGISFNTSTVAPQTLVSLYGANNNFMLLGITAAGKLQAVTVVTTDAGTTTTTLTSAATVTDGRTHRGSMRVNLDSGTGTGTLSLACDGVITSAAPRPFPVFAGTAYFPPYWGLFVGGPGLGGYGDLFNGTLAHVALFGTGASVSDARLLAHWNAADNGFFGESTDARIRRYATYMGVPAVDISTEPGTALGIAHADTSGNGPLEMMQKVIDTEAGLLFDGKDGRLTMHARAHRYNAPTAFTLDVAAQDTKPDLAPKLDDQGMCNDFTVSRPNGATIRSVDTASVAEYGYYRQDQELLAVSDAEVQSAADWRTSRYGTPRVKLSSLPIDLVTIDSSKIAAILAADLGSRFSLVNAPAQAPASAQDMFIEGIDMTISVDTFDVNLNVSAADLGMVWQLDSGTLSVLDSSTRLAY